MDVNPEPLHEAGHFALMARGSDSLASRQRIGEIATVLKCSASEWRGLGFDDTPRIFVHTLSPTDRIACTTITVIGAPSLIGACTKELTAEGGAVPHEPWSSVYVRIRECGRVGIPGLFFGRKL
jgi:hypothetical protein